jgi:hypothetical protein
MHMLTPAHVILKWAALYDPANLVLACAARLDLAVIPQFRSSHRRWTSLCDCAMHRRVIADHGLTTTMG